MSLPVPCLNDDYPRLLHNNNLDGTVPSDITKLIALEQLYAEPSPILLT